MLSKNKIKFVNSLKNKKYRDASGAFIIEGEKMVDELLATNLAVQEVFCTEDYLKDRNIADAIIIKNDELSKISSLKTPNQVLAIAEIPKTEINFTEFGDKLSLVYDDIRDPGNLGTIIRIADWYGIQNIICSKESVDAYNSKVVQSTMGAIFRVNIFYTDLHEFFSHFEDREDYPIYATLLDGENIYNKDIKNKGCIVFGNESKGISDQYLKYINQKLFIPNYPPDTVTSESLNVSIATAITCAEFRRRS